MLRQNQRSYVIRHTTASVTEPSTSKTVPPAVVLAASPNSPQRTFSTSPDSVTSPLPTMPTLLTPPTAQKHVNMSSKKTNSSRQVPTSVQTIHSRGAKKSLVKRKAESFTDVNDNVPANNSVSTSSTGSSGIKADFSKEHQHRKTAATVQVAGQEGNDDVQIHEISSSSESQKDRHTTIRSSKRRKLSSKCKIEKSEPVSAYPLPPRRAKHSKLDKSELVSNPRRPTRARPISSIFTARIKSTEDKGNENTVHTRKRDMKSKVAHLAKVR